MRPQQEQHVNGQPIHTFPLLNDLRKPEFIQRYPSLSSLITEIQDPFWHEAIQRAKTPLLQQTNLPAENGPFITKAALAIRALDCGMIDLPLDKKLIYLYSYLAADPSLFDPHTKEEKKINITQLFPFTSATQLTLMQELAAENGRLKRFLGYMEALQEIYAAGKSDILLITTGTPKGGMYSEIDFWVETQVKDITDQGYTISYVDIAQAIPKEFLPHVPSSIAQRENLIANIVRRLHRNYDRFQVSSFEVAMEKRFAVLQNVIQRSGENFILSCTINELAEQLGIPRQAAEYTIKKYEKQHGIIINVHQGRLPKPTPETIQLAEYIFEAYDALDKPGKRWDFGQLHYGDIASYIQEHHPELGIVITASIIDNIRDRYLDLSITQQHDGMPARRLSSRGSEVINTALKQALTELIRNGHSQHPDALAKSLQYTSGDRKSTRIRIRELLRELQEKGVITISDQAFVPVKSDKLSRHRIKIAIAQLKKQGFAWRHNDQSKKITSQRIAEQLQQMGLDIKRQEVATYLNNVRKTRRPIGEKVRPLINVLPEVDKYTTQGITDPEEIIARLESAYNQQFVRATKAKIRAHVLRPQVEAFVTAARGKRRRIPTVEEVRDHLGLKSTKILSRIYEELGYSKP